MSCINLEMIANVNNMNQQQELRIVKDSLSRSEAEICKLKELLNEMALSKQSLINDVYSTKRTNEKLTKRLDRQSVAFSAKDEAMKQEMEQVKMTLKIMQRSLHVSNRKLTRHMQRCAGTRFRLGVMFLRMRSTKRCHERRRNRYQQMCIQFAAYVREQNRYIQAAVDARLSRESITTCHQQYLDLLTRCSQLLHENMKLRMRSMNNDNEELTNESNRGESTAQESIQESTEIQISSVSIETILDESVARSFRRRSHSV